MSAILLLGMEDTVTNGRAKGLLVDLRAELGWGSVICIGPHLHWWVTCSAMFSHLGETLNGWMDQGLWFCKAYGKKSQGFKKVQCDGEKIKVIHHGTYCISCTCYDPAHECLLKFCPPDALPYPSRGLE